MLSEQKTWMNYYPQKAVMLQMNLSSIADRIFVTTLRFLKQLWLHLLTFVLHINILKVINNIISHVPDFSSYTFCNSSAAYTGAELLLLLLFWNGSLIKTGSLNFKLKQSFEKFLNWTWKANSCFNTPFEVLDTCLPQCSVHPRTATAAHVPKALPPTSTSFHSLILCAILVKLIYLQLPTPLSKMTIDILPCPVSAINHITPSTKFICFFKKQACIKKKQQNKQHNPSAKRKYTEFNRQGWACFAN